MPLPLYAKVEVSLVSLSCALLALLLVYDPALVVHSPLIRTTSRLTGLPMANVGEESRDAWAFSAYVLWIVAMGYALAVWEGNELFLRSVVRVRMGVVLFGLTVVLTTGLGGAALLTGAVVDLFTGSLLWAVLSGSGPLQHGKKQ